MKKVIVLLLAVMLVGCTDSSTAKRVLQSQGFTDVRITGYKAFACSGDDTTSTGFTATSPNGTRVRGAVCGGLLFKNSTIRLQ